MARPIVRSIWLTVLALFALQGAVATAVVLGYGPSADQTLWYVGVMPTLHLIMGIVLASLSKLFFNVETGAALSRVNVANVLSMVRVSSAPTLLWLVLLARTYPLVPIVVPLASLVFLTDLLDGQISRRTRQITKIGQYLDSSSDYTVLFVVAIALVSYDLVSAWLFTIVMLRFGLQIVGQVTLFIIQGMQIHFRTSFLGKASVFAVMTFFALSLVRLVRTLPNWFETVSAVAEYVTAVIAIVSLVEKAYMFVVDVRNARR
ncbi:MAG: CDP-alcohol phosphatidyltransferase family protein [Spirochaetota bacterium]